MIFYFLLISSIIVIIIHCWIRYRRFGRLLHEIPGPKSFPIVGNILRPYFIVPDTKKIWIMMQEWQKEWPIFKLWFSHLVMTLTRDPDHIKVILSCKKNINKETTGYSTAGCIGYRGLLVLNGEDWKNRRKILNPAFTPNMLEFYSKKMDVCSKKLISELMSHENSYVHDTWTIFNKFSFAVACEAIMDYNLDGPREQRGRKFRDGIHEISRIAYYRIYRPFIQDWMMKFLPVGRSQAKAVTYIDKFAREVIKERQNYHATCSAFKEYLNNVENCNENDINTTKKSLSVLDILLLSEEKGLINSREILEETATMIGVSYESTATALTFFTIALAENEEVQELARQEILDVVGGYGNIITTEHIKQLDYLERCAKESLRLYTVGPYIGRSVDDEFKLGKYTIPVGMEMYMNIFQLHRDPNLWPDPLKFDPDRFLPENVEKQHNFAYVPFSRGPRNCIGQKFAMTEIKIAIAHILYNYYLQPVDRSIDFEFNLGITLKVDQTRVRFTKISQTL